MAENCYDDICTALQPCYVFNACLGISEFSIGGLPRSRNLQLISLWHPYRVILHLFMIFGSFAMIIIHDIIAPFNFESVFGWYVVAFDMHSDLVVYALITIFTGWRRKTALRTLKSVINIDYEISGLNTFPLNRKIRHYVIFWIIINTLGIITMHVGMNSIVSHQKVHFFYFTNAFYCITNIYEISIQITFQAWLFSLKSRFECLNKLIFYYQSLDVSTVKQLRNFHLKLCGVTKEIDKIFSPAVLLIICVDFYVTVFQMYDLLTLLLKNKFVKYDFILFKGLWLLAFGINMFLIAVCGGLVRKHANLIKKHLFKLTISTNNREMWKEIRAFSLQLLHDDASISAAGFFTIDLPLIFTIVGAGTTYLVILIQFDLALAASIDSS